MDYPNIFLDRRVYSVNGSNCVAVIHECLFLRFNFPSKIREIFCRFCYSVSAFCLHSEWLSTFFEWLKSSSVSWLAPPLLNRRFRFTRLRLLYCDLCFYHVARSVLFKGYFLENKITIYVEPTAGKSKMKWNLYYML